MMTLAVARAKRLAGGSPLERRVRRPLRAADAHRKLREGFGIEIRGEKAVNWHRGKLSLAHGSSVHEGAYDGQASALHPALDGTTGEVPAEERATCANARR